MNDEYDGDDEPDDELMYCYDEFTPGTRR